MCPAEFLRYSQRHKNIVPAALLTETTRILTRRRYHCRANRGTNWANVRAGGGAGYVRAKMQLRAQENDPEQQSHER